MLIAIVDDEEEICKSLTRMLRAYGFETKSFISAADFLESRYVTDAACLILDVRMPDINGLDLQKRLRAQGHRIPILFITGYLDEQVRGQALTHGAIDILEKPFDDRVLIRKIKDAIIGPTLPMA